MRYFLDTVETIPVGVGFSHFGTLHLIWLAVFLLITVANCLWFRRLGVSGRDRWKKAVALLIVADELFKMLMLTIGGRYNFTYLPLHLCSINIFIIAIHAWKPNKTLGRFLYTVCIPGALAALLFPTWTSLPLQNFMHIHSFTIHSLLAMYPVVLAVSGEIKPRAKQIPKCLLLLICMAVPIYGINLLLDTNFMFLMYAETGNPLYWFQEAWGNHLLGFPILIVVIVIVMYLPLELYRKIKKKLT